MDGERLVDAQRAELIMRMLADHGPKVAAHDWVFNYHPWRISTDLSIMENNHYHMGFWDFRRMVLVDGAWKDIPLNMPLSWNWIWVEKKAFYGSFWGQALRFWLCYKSFKEGKEFAQMMCHLVDNIFVYFNFRGTDY